MQSHIKDKKLEKIGKKRVEWASRWMKVLHLIGEEFEKTTPLKGIRVAACLHVTTETANLLRVLKKGGAKVRLCASNPLSTQDDVAAFLVEEEGVEVFAIRGENENTYYNHIEEVLSFSPHITMDDGADLITTLHTKKKTLIPKIIGGTEETTTGVIRLKNMSKNNLLYYPVIAVNESLTKHLFDNRYGTGQSTVDGLLRATNLLIAGKVFVVCGYGWCGRGIATRVKGMGAEVIVVEVNPIRALEAKMDGFIVMESKKAFPLADVIITATGNVNVIDEKHFSLLKDGVILGNAGHFDVEINVKKMKEKTKKEEEVRKGVKKYIIEGKTIFLISEGRLLNLASAEGHPAEVMDLSFANQAMAVKYLVENGKKLENKVYTLPEEIDVEIAKKKLKTMKITIDTLTEEQKKYGEEWKLGT